MTESPKLTAKELAYLDNTGAHFKFKDMQARMKNMQTHNLQGKRSQQLLLYQQVFSQGMAEKLTEIDETNWRSEVVRHS